MQILLRRPVEIICLVSLLAVSGCGTTSPPPPESSEAVEPTIRSEAEAAPETLGRGSAPDISVTGQHLQVEPTDEPPGVEVVRRYTQMFYAGELKQLREKFSAEMKEEFPPGRLEEMRDQVRLNLGEETEIVGEDSQARDDYRGFARWARFSKHDGVVEIQWVLREDDTIAGFLIREAQPDRP